MATNNGVDPNYLLDLYKQADKLRMDILVGIKETPNFPKNLPEVPGATAELKDGILHITVNECLPRLCDVRVSPRIRNYWLGMMRRALSGINAVFKHALCLIIVYAPSTSVWDPDNRAVKFIIDGLRYNRLIPDDSWDYISYLVTGRPDSEHPRTEVYVIDAGKNYIENIQNMVISNHNMATQTVQKPTQTPLQKPELSTDLAWRG